jgi:hypothetical protein
MKRASSWGARRTKRAISVASFRSVTAAIPSAWPATMCPPSSSPTLSERSRLIRVPWRQRPIVVIRSVSAAASTANQVRPFSSPMPTTVRHTPEQAIEAPSTIEARG